MSGYLLALEKYLKNFDREEGERGGKERKLRMRTGEREIQKLKVLKTYFVKQVKIKKNVT